MTSYTTSAISLLFIAIIGTGTAVMGQAKPVKAMRRVIRQADARLHEIGRGLATYVVAKEGPFPSMTNIQDFKREMRHCVKSQAAFIDPATNKPFKLNPRCSKIDEFGGLPGDLPLDNIDTLVVVYQAQPARDGSRLVLFADGHTQKIGAVDWRETLAEARGKSPLHLLPNTRPTLLPVFKEGGKGGR